MSSSNGNCNHIFETETIVSEAANANINGENKKETELFKGVKNGVERERSCSPQLFNESEGSVSGSVSSRSSPSLSKATVSNASEAESVCSEMSLYSGPGSVTDGLFLRKNGNEYFFAHSHDSDAQKSEQLSHNKDRTESFANGEMISHAASLEPSTESLMGKTPVCFDFTSDSQSSFSISMPSPDTSESDFTLKLSEKDADSSSNKSSPEHQAPITRYFKSITGPKCRTKLITNSVSSGMSYAENSPEVKNRLAFCFYKWVSF